MIFHSSSSRRSTWVRAAFALRGEQRPLSRMGPMTTARWPARTLLVHFRGSRPEIARGGRATPGRLPRPLAVSGELRSLARPRAGIKAAPKYDAAPRRHRCRDQRPAVAAGATNGSQRLQPPPEPARPSQNVRAGEWLPVRLSPTVTDIRNRLGVPYTEEVTGSNPVRPTISSRPCSTESDNRLSLGPCETREQAAQPKAESHMSCSV